MKKTYIIVAVVVVAIVVIYLLVSGGSSSSAPSAPAVIAPSPAETTPAPTVPIPSSVTVSIKNFSFNPSILTVKVGTKVTWVNDDAAAHTITSDSGTFLDSGTFSPGQSFSFTFTDPGSFGYHCNIHRSMKGAVIVE